MADHSFNPFIAQKYDVNCAIFINSLVYWTRLNASNDNNFHDERYWTYNTHEALIKYFPYWSSDQIKRIIKKLREWGLIVVGNYNQKGYDRTNWYALSDQALYELNLDKTCLQPAMELIGRNRQMDQAKSPNGSGEIARPIPVTNAVTNSSNNIYKQTPKIEQLTEPEKPYTYMTPFEAELERTKSQEVAVINKTPEQDLQAMSFSLSPYKLTESDKKAFLRFWEIYPVGSAFERTAHAFFNNGCHKFSSELLEKLKKQIALDRRFKEERFTPSSVNYLNQKLWNDALPTGKSAGVGGFDHSKGALMTKDIFDEGYEHV